MKLFLYIFAALCYVNIAAAARQLTRKEYETSVKNLIDYTALAYNLGY